MNSNPSLQAQITILSEMLSDSDLTPHQRAKLLFERGKLFWRLGQRGEATSDYAAAKNLDPTSPAAVALDQANDIASFFNPDIYNP